MTTTEKEILLYKEYSKYPLEHDKIIVPLPFDDKYKKIEINSSHQTIDLIIQDSSSNNNRKMSIKNIVLYLQFRREEDVVKYLDDVIQDISFSVKDIVFQKYSGSFLDTLYALENRKIHKCQRNNQISLNIPISFHQYKDFPIYLLSSLKMEINFKHKEYFQSYLIVHYKYPNKYWMNCLDDKLFSGSNRITYLHEQQMTNGVERFIAWNSDQSVDIRIRYNNPCKFICWSLFWRRARHKYPAPIIKRAQILLDGEELTDMMDASFFNDFMASRFNVTNHHSYIANSNLYCYSFAEKPTWPRPTGAVDLSDREILIRMELMNRDLMLSQNDHPESYTLEIQAFGISYNIIAFEVGDREDKISGEYNIELLFDTKK